MEIKENYENLLIFFIYRKSIRVLRLQSTILNQETVVREINSRKIVKCLQIDEQRVKGSISLHNQFGKIRDNSKSLAK